jgi:hypothetical protein
MVGNLLTFAALAGAVGLACAPRVAIAEPAPSREYQVKAAFIYNFVQFVEWPEEAFADARSPIVITVLGENPFGSALEQVTRGKSVRGREIVVRYARAVAGVGRTHVLFVAAAEAARAGQVVGEVGAHVLTVADTENFAAAGGVIRLFSEDNKLRFEINTSAVGRAGLKVSAKLMQLAKVYKEG